MTMTEFNKMSATSDGAAVITNMMREYADRKGVLLRDIDVRNFRGNAQFYVRVRPFVANND